MILIQVKPWVELSLPVKLYYSFTIVSLLALLGLTITSIYKQHTETDEPGEDDFTVSLIQMVGICEYCNYLCLAHSQTHTHPMRKICRSEQ